MTEAKPWYDGEVTGAMRDFIALEKAYRVDSLVSALDSALERQGLPDGRALTDAELTVIAVNSLEERVNMGGYASFFNDDRDLSPIILRSLTAIGATECAALTKEALEVGGVADFLSGQSESDMFDDDTEEALNLIDQRYFEQGIAMCDAIWAFVKTNSAEITLEAGNKPVQVRSDGILARLLDFFRGSRK